MIAMTWVIGTAVIAAMFIIRYYLLSKFYACRRSVPADEYNDAKDDFTRTLYPLIALYVLPVLLGAIAAGAFTEQRYEVVINARLALLALAAVTVGAVLVDFLRAVIRGRKGPRRTGLMS